ncbi:MAG: ATP-binding protein [Oligoflexia bacterium]|nr:ATP-binding protein [Oligoflexia bacterium]
MIDGQYYTKKEFLAKLTQTLSQSLKYEQTLSDLAHLVVPDLSDWCAIDLISEKEEIQRFTVVHSDPSKSELARDLKSKFTPSIFKIDQNLADVMSGRSILVTADDWKNVNPSTAPRQMKLIQALGVSSYAVIPLRARGQTFGAISLFTANRSLTPEDLAFFEEVGRTAALAVDNARLFENAQRALQTREDTLAIVCHDLKNPLTAIQLGVELLRVTLSSKAPPEILQGQFKKIADNIEKSAKQANQLVKSLLDLATIESGNFQIETSPMPVREVIQEALALIGVLAAQKEIQLKDEFSDSPCIALVDHIRILQVMSNLLGNAVKFTPPGGAICVRSECESNEVRISVIDSGTGIAADFLPHLFDRYYQPKSSRRQGTGLGLFIAQGIVEAHGGTISVRSEVGKGSCFTFTLRAASELVN